MIGRRIRQLCAALDESARQIAQLEQQNIILLRRCTEAERKLEEIRNISGNEVNNYGNNG